MFMMSGWLAISLGFFISAPNLTNFNFSLDELECHKQELINPCSDTNSLYYDNAENQLNLYTSVTSMRSSN